MVQWKCMEALKVETMMLDNLAQSMKEKYEERRSWWWCRGGDVCVPNCQVRPGEAVWRILVINLWGGVARWRHSVCMLLDVDVEKAQLEVELVTPGSGTAMETLWAREFFKRTTGISGIEKCIAWLVGLPEKTKGNWRQVNLLEDGFDHSGGRRGFGAGLWNYLKILM